MHGRTGGVLGGHVDASVGPGRAELDERRHQQVIDDGLEGALGEHLVERGTGGSDVEVRSGLHEALHEGRLPRMRGLIGQAQGCVRRHGHDGDLAGKDCPTGFAGGPAGLGQLAYAHERGDGVVVVEPVARSGALWPDHAVAALPGTDEGNADAGADRGLLDAVHALSMIAHASSSNKHLTSIEQTAIRAAQQVYKP